MLQAGLCIASWYKTIICSPWKGLSCFLLCLAEDVASKGHDVPVVHRALSAVSYFLCELIVLGSVVNAFNLAKGEILLTGSEHHGKWWNLLLSGW